MCPLNRYRGLHSWNIVTYCFLFFFSFKSRWQLEPLPLYIYCYLFNNFLKPGLMPFCPNNFLISHSFCRFVHCTSLMRISYSPASQRHATPLKFDNYGGLRLLELCEGVIRGRLSQRDGDCQHHYSGCGVYLWCVNAQLLLKQSKVCQKISPHHLTYSLNLWYKEGQVHMSMLVMPNCDLQSQCCSWNWDSLNEARSFLSVCPILLSQWDVVPYAYLTRAAPSVVFCCCM